MNEQKQWMELELPQDLLEEVASEAIRLGATPSSLFAQAWTRSRYRVSEAAFEVDDVNRMATRIILDSQAVSELRDLADREGTSINELLGWAWATQRNFYRTRRAGSLICGPDHLAG